MTQLALLLALSLIGSVLSFGFGRLEVRRVAISSTLQRAEGAIERAALGFWRVGALRGLLLLTAPAVGLAGFGLLGEARAGVSGLGRAAFLLLALVLGAASCLLQARVTLSLGARGAAAAASSVAKSSARALRPLIRAAAAGAIFGESLGLLGVSAAFAALYAVRGGFAGAADGGHLASEVVRLLPAFALGAAVMALALARLGGVSAAAAQVGSAHSSSPSAGLAPADARDPALLAELVGQLAGEVLPRALLTYVVGTGATVSLALLAVAASPTAAALSGLVLALLIRAFGAIASLCGVFATRSSDDEAPLRALWRGQLSAFLVASFGLGAALFWLQKDKLGPLFASGELGLAQGALLAFLSWLPLRRRAALRELQEVRAASSAAAIARGASAGLSSLWPLLTVPALLLAAAEKLAGLAPTPLLLATFVASALALAPLSLAFGGFGALVTHSRGIAALARLELESGRPGTSGLDDAVALADRAGATHAALGLGFSLLLGLLALSGGAPPSTPSSVGIPLLATFLGVTLVLLFGAWATRSAVVTGRLVGSEVERQLHEPLRKSSGALPNDFAPSYKACLEALLSAARALPVLDALGLLLAPFVLAALLRELKAPLAPALLGFGLSALLTGIVVSLSGRATRAALAEQRKRSRGVDAGAPALVEADSFGALIGVTATASVEALVVVFSLTVICLAPLLS